MSDLLRHRTSGFANSSIGPPHLFPLYAKQARVTEDVLPGFSRDEFLLLQGLVGVIKLFLLMVVVLLVNLALLVGFCFCLVFVLMVLFVLLMEVFNR